MPDTAAPETATSPRRRPTGGCLVVPALLALLLWWGWPLVRNAGRVARLAMEPAPASLPVPVQGVAPGQLVDTWGAARSEGRSHEGIDIFAPRGTPVVAATRGVVIKRGENRLGGRIVTVMGPGRQFHYYAHLDDWAAVEKSDWVEAGTVLGYVGSSGNARNTPPHLHYGIYTPTGAINPYSLFGRRGD